MTTAALFAKLRSHVPAEQQPLLRELERRFQEFGAPLDFLDRCTAMEAAELVAEQGWVIHGNDADADPEPGLLLTESAALAAAESILRRRSQ